MWNHLFEYTIHKQISEWKWYVHKCILIGSGLILYLKCWFYSIPSHFFFEMRELKRSNFLTVLGGLGWRWDPQMPSWVLLRHSSVTRTPRRWIWVLVPTATITASLSFFHPWGRWVRIVSVLFCLFFILIV